MLIKAYHAYAIFPYFTVNHVRYRLIEKICPVPYEYVMRLIHHYRAAETRGRWRGFFHLVYVSKQEFAEKLLFRIVQAVKLEQHSFGKQLIYAYLILATVIYRFTEMSESKNMRYPYGRCHPFCLPSMLKPLPLCPALKPVHYVIPCRVIIRALIHSKVTEGLVKDIRKQLMHTIARKEAFGYQVTKHVKPFFWVNPFRRPVYVYPEKIRNF